MTAPGWVSCPWCTLRVQGCRCAAPCGATWCERIIGAPHTNPHT